VHPGQVASAQRRVEDAHLVRVEQSETAALRVGSGHYLGFCYDYRALAAELEAVGFVVQRCATGESEYAELRGLETRTHPAESATQLCVEAIKPLNAAGR